MNDESARIAAPLHEAGNYDLARDHTTDALKLYQRLKDLSGEANAWHQLGRIDYRVGDLRAAHSATHRALKIQRKLGDEGGEAACLTQLAMIALALSDYADALVVTKGALTIFQRLGNTKGEATSWFHLGEVEFALRHADTARSMTERALSLYEDWVISKARRLACIVLGRSHSLSEISPSRVHSWCVPYILSAQSVIAAAKQ